MTIYDRYATVYDGSGQVRFALLTAVYLREILRAHPVVGRRMLDIACGTGTLALLMADDGWHVTGVDRSAEMLARAEAKLAGARPLGSARFLRGDMRRLAETLPAASYDLATCAYDSLNYMLTPADLTACFASAAHALAPGGLFVGDMNTRHFLEFEWGGCAVQEQDGYVQIERSHFDPAHATSTMLLTGFIGDDAQGYDRFDEVHVERAYPDDEVAAMIAAAGLQLVARYDSFTFHPPGPQTQRIVWVARRMKDEG